MVHQALHWASYLLIGCAISLVMLIVLSGVNRLGRFCDRWGRYALLGTVVFAVVSLVLLFASYAFAQTPADVAQAVCSPDGTQIVTYVAGAIIASGLFTLLQKAIAKLPPPLQHVLNLVFGNWRQILVATGVLKA